MFGDDDDGDPLLAVFPRPEPEMIEDEQALHTAMTLEGGQMVEIDMALTESIAGEVRTYVIQISYGHSLRRIDGTQSIRQ
jgi:hypothetical protein